MRRFARRNDENDKTRLVRDFSPLEKRTFKTDLFCFKPTVRRKIQKSGANASNSSRDFCLSKLYRGKSERAGEPDTFKQTVQGKSFIPKGGNSLGL